jgi:hypothetical protein
MKLSSFRAILNAIAFFAPALAALLSREPLWIGLLGTYGLTLIKPLRLNLNFSLFGPANELAVPPY